MSCNQSGFCAFGNSWWWIIILLLIFGTGSIKGFASTLIISVVVSFFTATFITRWLLKSFVNLGFTKKWLYTR